MIKDDQQPIVSFGYCRRPSRITLGQSSPQPRFIDRRHFVKLSSVLAIGGATAQQAVFGAVFGPAEIVSGVVVDVAGAPFPDAMVSHGGNSILTDADGSFELPLDISDPFVRISSDGFVAQNRLVTATGMMGQTLLFPSNYDVGLGEPVGPPYAPVANSVTELTQTQLAEFTDTHPDFAALRLQAHSQGYTTEGPAWYIDSNHHPSLGQNGVGLALFNESTNHLLTVFHVPPIPEVAFEGATLLAGTDGPNSINYIDASGTAFRFTLVERAEESEISIILDGPQSLHFIDINCAPDQPQDKKEAFAKWLRDNEGLNAFWLKLILVSYITLIFGPLGWVACFFTLWVVGDSIQRCKNEACKQFPS